jgi:hypothetical protein
VPNFQKENTVLYLSSNRTRKHLLLFIFINPLFEKGLTSSSVHFVWNGISQGVNFLNSMYLSSFQHIRSFSSKMNCI